MTGSSVAILRLGENLLASLQGTPDDAALAAFQDELTEHIRASHAWGVVLDVSKLELVDSYAARVVMDLTAVSRLVGARVVVAGIRPAVAITMASHGLRLPGVETAASAAEAMSRLQDSRRTAP